jgi:hypothetical protein
MMASKDASEITRALRTEYIFKFKGAGPVEYHHGCGYSIINMELGDLGLKYTLII